MKPDDIVVTGVDQERYLSGLSGRSCLRHGADEPAAKAVAWSTTVPSGGGSGSADTCATRLRARSSTSRWPRRAASAARSGDADSLQIRGHKADPCAGKSAGIQRRSCRRQPTHSPHELHMPRETCRRSSTCCSPAPDRALRSARHGQDYVAQALAEHIVGTTDASRAQLVQFHPSYAYEDFFEGYRPDRRPTAGQSAFAAAGRPAAHARQTRARRAPGAAVRADHRRDQPGQPRQGVRRAVLPAGVPRRARPAAVLARPSALHAAAEPVHHRHDEHRRPVDRAGRRGDAPPVRVRRAAPRRTEPVQGVLRRWLAANDQAGRPRAELLDALNDAIEDDRDFADRPVVPDAPEARHGPDGLERIWRTTSCRCSRSTTTATAPTSDRSARVRPRRAARKARGASVSRRRRRADRRRRDHADDAPARGLTVVRPSTSTSWTPTGVAIALDDRVARARRQPARSRCARTVAALAAAPARTGRRGPRRRLPGAGHAEGQVGSPGCCSCSATPATPAGATRTSSPSTASDDLWPALAESLSPAGRTALAQGVLQGYRRVDDALPPSAGASAIGDQIARRSGLPIPLEVTLRRVHARHRREPASCAPRCAGCSPSPAVRRRPRAGCAHLDARLAGVSSLRRGAPLPAWQPTRLNARYHAALRLAELVLRNSSDGGRCRRTRDRGLRRSTWPRCSRTSSPPRSPRRFAATPVHTRAQYARPARRRQPMHPGSCR